MKSTSSYITSIAWVKKGYAKKIPKEFEEDDEDIQHYEGEVDPVRDLDIIQGELMEKDKVLINKNIEELEKVIKRTNGKAEIEERDTLKKVNFFMIIRSWNCMRKI